MNMAYIAETNTSIYFRYYKEELENAANFTVVSYHSCTGNIKPAAVMDPENVVLKPQGNNVTTTCGLLPCSY